MTRYDLNPNDLDFANPLPAAEAYRLTDALDTALKAMVSYGCSDEDVVVLSALRVVAMRHGHDAFQRRERFA
jgi:hypothetical protein